jgi:2,4-dienoyl-CoA reductase-like NADH-dependent reductase (Old Yellow Enzyme family)
VEGGLQLEDALEVSRALAEAGVDALDVSLVSQGAWQEMGDGKFLVPASAFPKEAPPAPIYHLWLRSERLPVFR